MKSVRKRLTYANVMSSLAVFLVVAGGSAFAASQLGKNTVGTKQLKKEAVTGAKIKNGAVTGAKVNLATFGQVPSAKVAESATTAGAALKADTATRAETAAKADAATKADTATKAENASALGGVPASGYARNQLEAVHLVGAAGEPAFEGGCGNLSSPFEPTGFYKDPFGIVHLQGEVTGCASTIGPTFVLPPGFRPAKDIIFVVHTATDTVPGAVRIEPNGQIERFSAAQAGINGITFRVGG